MAGARRPCLPADHRGQGEVGVVERQPRFEQVLAEPVPGALRRAAVVVVLHRVAAQRVAAVEQVRRHVHQDPPGEVRVRRQVFEHRQRRGAFQRELDRTFAGELLPHRQLHVEQHARGAHQHGRIALARVDPRALLGPRAGAVAVAGFGIPLPPIRFPAAQQQRRADDRADQDPAPWLRGHVALGHGLGNARPVRGGQAHEARAFEVVRRCAGVECPGASGREAVRTGSR